MFQIVVVAADQAGDELQLAIVPVRIVSSFTEVGSDRFRSLVREVSLGIDDETECLRETFRLVLPLFVCCVRLTADDQAQATEAI